MRWRWYDKAGAAAVGALLTMSLGIAIWAGWQALYPAHRWYDLRSVSVATPTRVGSSIELVVDRSILRPFTGHYVVSLINVDTSERVCSGGASDNYEPDRRLPSPLTLGWWTEGARPPCMEALTPGLFRLRTCVEIMHGIPFVGRRESCADSNLFRITP